jgi:hypothetical protein
MPVFITQCHIFLKKLQGAVEGHWFKSNLLAFSFYMLSIGQHKASIVPDDPEFNIFCVLNCLL